MAIVSLHAHPHSFDYGKCNLTENCGIINTSCSIENSLNWLISCVHLKLIYYILNATPHTQV